MVLSYNSGSLIMLTFPLSLPLSLTLYYKKSIVVKTSSTILRYDLMALSRTLSFPLPLTLWDAVFWGCHRREEATALRLLCAVRPGMLLMRRGSVHPHVAAVQHRLTTAESSGGSQSGWGGWIWEGDDSFALKYLSLRVVQVFDHRKPRGADNAQSDHILRLRYDPLHLA